MRGKTAKLVVVFVFVVLAVAGFECSFDSMPVFAKPAFMDRYQRDPYARDELKTRCTLCHIGHGGGERNDFGEAFEDAGYRFSKKLRDKFPQYFKVGVDK